MKRSDKTRQFGVEVRTAYLTNSGSVTFPKSKKDQDGIKIFCAVVHSDPPEFYFFDTDGVTPLDFNSL